jgi:hypothetical protein
LIDFANYQFACYIRVWTKCYQSSHQDVLKFCDVWITSLPVTCRHHFLWLVDITSCDSLTSLPVTHCPSFVVVIIITAILWSNHYSTKYLVRQRNSWMNYRAARLKPLSSYKSCCTLFQSHVAFLTPRIVSHPSTTHIALHSCAKITIPHFHSFSFIHASMYSQYFVIVFESWKLIFIAEWMIF